MSVSEENLTVEQTPITPDQVRMVLELREMSVEELPEISTLGELALFLHVPLEEAVELRKQAIAQTPITPAQIRAVMRLKNLTNMDAPEVATMGELGAAFNMEPEEIADLLQESEAASAVLPPVPAVATSNKPVWLNLVAVVLSFLGIFVASVLSIAHAFALSVPCGENGGCDVVAASSYSAIAGIPVAYLGLGAYLALATISVLRAFLGLQRTMKLGTTALIVSGIGALFSFYLQFISFTQIHAVCLWCLTSAVTMCVMFFVQAWLAQMDIPETGTERREAASMLAIGLAMFAILGTGYESMHFFQTGKKANLGMYKGSLADLLLTKDSMRLGPDDAPVKIVEFSDLVCPSCREMYPSLKAIVNGHPGKVQLILRHRPLTHNPDHKMALPAAVIAVYANDKSNKGWAFADAMYDHDISELQDMDSIYKVAKSVGIDVTEAKSHMKDDDPYFKLVLRDLDTAEKIDVATTPTFVVFSPGQPQPTVVTGHALLTELEKPQYQSIFKDGK